MAGDPSDRLLQQVHRLFNSGAVGTMTDPQLLDQIVSRRREAAEGAFEELVIRHGPMVLRVCRSVLHDAHDAEDAFQAVFLVLSNRAGSIRRCGSLASWLFGVAQRVAIRAKRSAARRRARIQLVAERTQENCLPTENDPDWEILHEEIKSLPERLRAPIVLCYLQGLTYAAAACQLGLSEMTIRGRLDRARKWLRQRLTRRGVTIPAGLVVAGAAGQAQAAVPMTLIHSTIRITLGFMVGNTAAILARGVLNSMLLHQLRVTTVLLCLGLGGSYWAWHAVAAAMNARGQTNPRPAVVRTPDSSPPPRTDRYGDPLPPGVAMRLGTVRFRQAQSIRHIVYSPDGQLVVTDGGQYRLLVWDARDGKMLRQVDLGIEGIGDLVFSPDGKTIATVGFQPEPKRNVVVNHLVLADAATGRVAHRGEWDDRYIVERVAYAPDGKTVATVSLDSTLRLWDVPSMKLFRRERLVGEARLSPESITFSQDATSRLLAIAWRGTIELWDVAHFNRTQRIAIDARYRPDSLIFSPDGTILATGEASVGAETRLWRVGDGTLLRQFKSQRNTGLSHMAFSPDGKVLAAIESNGPLVFFDTATGKELGSFRKELSSGMGFDLLADSFSADRPLAFSPDGRTLAATGSRQSLHFWDLATGKDRLATPEAHLGDVVTLACLADGKTVVSGSRDRTVRVWDLATGRPTSTLPHENWVDSLSVSADGSVLATGTAWGKVNLWNLKTGERIHTWSVGQKLVQGVTFSGDGSSVIAALNDGTLRCWDVSPGKERPIAQPKLEKFPDQGPGGGLAHVNRAVFSRDGRSVAMISGGWMQVVDLASGDRRFKEVLGAQFWATKACEFAPSSGSLAIVREVHAGFRAGSLSGSRMVASTIVWLDSQTGSVRREIAIPESGVLALAFSPDGQAIAAGTFLTDPARGIIRIFRLRDKREIQSIETPCPWIETLCFTPDGKQIVAGLQDTSIVIWDVRPTR